MGKLDSKLSTRPAAELAPFVMDEGMSLGAPTLRVRRLRPMLDFYVGRLGLTPRVIEDGVSGLRTVDLGFARAPGPALLTLREDPKARQAPSDFAGLYHYAALVPDRRSLASTFLAIGSSGVAYEGFADHQVSESLYLHDVEGNGMEIYADRPRSTWSDWRKISERIAATGDVSLMAPMSQPLDFESLLGELGRGRRPREARGLPRGGEDRALAPEGDRPREVGEVLPREARFGDNDARPADGRGVPLGWRIPPSPRAQHLAQPRWDAPRRRRRRTGRAQGRRACRGQS